MDFATSSHRQRWLYTRTGLTEERHRLQQRVEEYYTRAADIARSFDVTEDLVVKQEVALLEGLNFDLVVHSPYRALQGLMQLSRMPATCLDAAARASFGALDALMLSDAPLLYGPAQMAAAALRSGFKAKGVRARDTAPAAAREM
eukprot:XP_001692753.1 predicted protein [Chlamydomonas reinhardtii]